LCFDSNSSAFISEHNKQSQSKKRTNKISGGKRLEEEEEEENEAKKKSCTGFLLGEGQSLLSISDANLFLFCALLLGFLLGDGGEVAAQGAEVVQLLLLAVFQQVVGNIGGIDGGEGNEGLLGLQRSSIETPIERAEEKYDGIDREINRHLDRQTGRRDGPR
jgi:hypothetical protein